MKDMIIKKQREIISLLMGFTPPIFYKDETLLKLESELASLEAGEEKENMIEYEGFKYWYEYKLAKDRIDICLATKDPKKYCNGYFLYSQKDPGDGKEFVIIKTDNPDLSLAEQPKDESKACKSAEEILEKKLLFDFSSVEIIKYQILGKIEKHCSINFDGDEVRVDRDGMVDELYLFMEEYASQKLPSDEDIKAYFTSHHYDDKNGHHYRVKKDRIFGAKAMRDGLIKPNNK